MQDGIGRKTWVFPDGELPPAGSHELKGHESIVILNMTKEKAHIKFTLYFENSDPYKDIEVSVDPERVRCFRMDHVADICGYSVQLQTQYAICLTSNVPIIVQYGRLDTREQPMAFYTNTGYSI